MKRRRMSFKKHARKFNRARRNTKAVNSPRVMRGGFRF